MLSATREQLKVRFRYFAKEALPARKKTPKSRTIPPFGSLDQPNNESALHYRTKMHLARELSKTNTLDIIKRCSTRCNVDAPSSYPYWSCTNTKVEKAWLQGWKSAQPEALTPSGAKVDVGLLQDDSGTLSGVLEVLMTSPMTDKKLLELSKRKIKWLEVQADVSLFRDSSKLTTLPRAPHAPPPPPPWSHDKPLPVIDTSDGHWTCPTCLSLTPDTLSFQKIVSIVDVYSSAITFEGRGQIRRKVFGIFRQHVPKVWERPNGEEISHFFLVEGTQLLTIGRLGLHDSPQESLLLASTHPTPNANTPKNQQGIALDPKEIKKCATSPSNWSQPPLDYFHQFVQAEIQKELSRDAGAIVDVRLEWPGSSISEFFTNADKMGSLVSISGITSIGKLFASLTRIVGLRYRFDFTHKVWLQSRNFRQDAIGSAGASSL